MTRTTDRAALDQWYCVDDLDDIVGTPRRTCLLGQEIVVGRDAYGAVRVNEVAPDGSVGAAAPVKQRYGYA